MDFPGTDDDLSLFRTLDLWQSRYSVHSIWISCLSKGLCTAVSNAASGVRLSRSDEVGGEISSNKLLNKSDSMLGHF